MNLRQIAAVAGTLALAACAQQRDAASEEPVSVRAGLYEIKADSIGLWGMNSRRAAERGAKEVCLSDTDIGSWPRTFVRNSIAMDSDCAVAAPQRTGNAFAGTVFCPVEEREASGEFRIAYTGTLDRERSEIHARMTMDVKTSHASDKERLAMAAAGQVLKNVELTVTAVRKGDCS